VSPAKPSAPRDPARAVRVVIADDDVEVRTLVDFILRQDPTVLLVGEAEDGESAIILVRQAQPDLVVMDVMMPGVGRLHPPLQAARSGGTHHFAALSLREAVRLAGLAETKEG
jgi:DNA-binding NarL/FixJ family response regulator